MIARFPLAVEFADDAALPVQILDDQGKELEQMQDLVQQREQQLQAANAAISAKEAAAASANQLQ